MSLLKTLFNWTSVVLCCLISIAPVASQFLVLDTVITIQDEEIFFESDQYNLDSVDLHLLNSISRSDSVYTYLLTGHTDSDGSDAYNMDLSSKRVNAVRNHLVHVLGIDSTRIMTDFRGESDPASTNLTDKGKQLNRRVTVQRQYPVKLRSVNGRMLSLSGKKIKDGKIFMQSRYYRDSFPVSPEGHFNLLLPDDEFVRLNGAARNHFYIDTLIRVTPVLSRDSIKVGLPFMEVNQRYVLPQMHFVGNRDILLERSFSSLDALTRTMVNSDLCAIIEGHVNRPSSRPMDKGTFEYNLAMARSARIFDHLRNHGVDSLRMNPIGYSNWYMVNPYAETEHDQELNRRVEMVIRDCNELFTLNQDNAIIPGSIGTHKRLHHINH